MIGLWQLWERESLYKIIKRTIVNHWFCVFKKQTNTKQVAWNTYDSKKNTADTFSKEEQETWNSEKKTTTVSQEGVAKK